MNENNFKALKSRPPSRGLSKLWIDFYIWWVDSVWLYAPRWAQNTWFRFSYNFWYPYISCSLFPRQKWLTKKIGRVWQDKDSLVVTVLYECLIHYVEQEECFESVYFSEENEKMIREIYQWVKVGRAEVLDKQMKAYPPLKDTWDFETVSLGVSNYETPYGEVNRYESIVKETDNRYLEWIVKNRSILWT